MRSKAKTAETRREERSPQKSEQAIPGRERILLSAIEEFAAKGLTGARTEDIAQRAGINKQALFHHFGSKDGLYKSVLERVLNESRTSDEDRDFSSMPPRAAIEAFIELVINRSLSDVQYRRLISDANWHEGRHLADFPSPMPALLKRIETLRSILDRGVEQGVFREGLDALDLYITVLGVFAIRQTNSATLSITLGADLDNPAGRERSKRNGIDLILAGISK